MKCVNKLNNPVISCVDSCDKATNECKVDVSNSNFWADPCWAIAKYVTINYECEGKSRSFSCASHSRAYERPLLTGQGQ